jgi:uncharacterized phage protein gp47/JayE
VAVVVMVVLFYFVDGLETSVGCLANHMLELQGGVVDAEALAQDAVDAIEDAIAFGRRNVGDGDVAGEGVGVGAEAPDVEIVDVFYAVDLLEGGANLVEGEAAGRAFQQDVEGLQHDGDG